MRRIALTVMLLLVGCGPNLTGTWNGTLTGQGPNGASSYADTWNVSPDAANANGLQVLSTQTCTKWLATQGGALATWSTLCGGYQFAGTMQVSGQQLSVNFTMTTTSLTPYPPGETATITGTLTRQ